MSSAGPDLRKPVPASGKTDRAARRPARRKITPPLWKRILVRVLLGFGFLLIIVIIAGIVLYFNRNAFYESAAKRILKERGYDASLSVESITTERAIINNITLSQNGERFAKAKRLTATYDWNDLFEGKLLTLSVTEPRVSLKIDKSGKIISNWLPEPSGRPVTLPSQGIDMTGADIDVTSPYGDFTARGDVFAKSLTDFRADINLQSANLSTRGYGAKVDAQLSAVRKGAGLQISGGTITLGTITGPNGPIASAHIKLAGDIDLPIDSDVLIYSGDADITATDFTGPFFTSKQSDIVFNGRAGFNIKTQTVTPSAFDVIASLRDLSLSDPARRKDLAGRVTLNKTLSATPVAGSFIGDITAQIETLLAGADWDAGLAVDYRGDGYSVDLKTPLRVTGSNASLTFSPAPSGPEFAFSKTGADLALRSRIDMAGDRALSLRSFNITGKTDNGYLWTNIERVSGRAVSRETWTEDAVRLAPFDARIGYRGGENSTIKITSALDYDGPLLGNEFENLTASGALTLRQVRGGFDLFFDSPQKIEAALVRTPFGYRAKNLLLLPASSEPLLSRRGGQDKLALAAKDVSALIISDDGQDIYTLTADAADLKGIRSGGSETYTAQASGLLVLSDTVAGEGSRLRAPQIDISLTRAPDMPVTYSIKSPAIRAKARTVTLLDVGVDLSGTPDDVAFTHAGGTVTLAGSNLPPLPVTGKGRFKDGRLIGEAKTALPRASEFPIYVDYNYERGQGSAVLDIPKFIFSPGGVQPQDLAPALRGKIAGVEGVAGVSAKIDFKPGQPITSEGTVKVANMNIGTLVGPLTGVAAELKFDSLYPLRSSGNQTVTMEGFDPGIPLGEGTVTFAIVKDGFDLINARWPMGTGEISVMPTFWSTTGAVNNVTVDVRDISLGELIARLGNENLSATGQINGTLPVSVDGVNLRVNQGRLLIEGGGVISVKTKQLDAAGEKNEVAKIAVDALKDFTYDELSLELNGPLDGDMKLGAVFLGSNPEVLGGAQFLFRTTIEGELANIARNLASATQMQNIKKSVAQKVEDAKIKANKGADIAQ